MKKLLTTLLVLLMVMGFCFAGGGSETKSEAAAPAAESHIPTGEAPKVLGLWILCGGSLASVSARAKRL